MGLVPFSVPPFGDRGCGSPRGQETDRLTARAPGQLAPIGNIKIRQRDGVGWQEVPLHSAGQAYLRLIRNATHSFRSMARDPHDVSLLAAHIGAIPDALPDLAFMHLMRFLVEPRLPHD
jgi:hypothetical protein